jgi:molybdenum-dependent DNA-binding transcriptional regulator ModE
LALTKPVGGKAIPLDLHETERRLIVQALASTNGNITAAAKKLGISRRTLHRKINEMNAEKVLESGDATETRGAAVAGSASAAEEIPRLHAE